MTACFIGVWPDNEVGVAKWLMNCEGVLLNISKLFELIHYIFALVLYV